MNTLSAFLLHNWQRKALALLSALVIWLFVNHSIIETKTLSNVPIRIINLPPDKTVQGLLPNRLLSKRVMLTMSGTKDVIKDLEAGDLEVLLDVSTADNNDWVVHIGKKNLVSLNPSIDLLHHISQVSHQEFVLKLGQLESAKIPIRVMPPTGEAPSGYEYLDVWPQQLMQTISGSEEEIQELKSKGFELTLDLNEVSKADLDVLKTPNAIKHDDEISFMVPDKWKKVTIPCEPTKVEEINDPEAQALRIDFLREGFLPINKELPVRVFYPVKYSDTINPATYPLATNQRIRKVNDIALLSLPLFVRNVSRFFLDLVTENMEIVIVAAPKSERDLLQWSVEVVNAHELEDVYVTLLLSSFGNNVTSPSTSTARKEVVLRKRFREYMRRLALHVSPEHKLRLESLMGNNAIKVSLS